MKTPTTYTLEISEGQRIILQEALLASSTRSEERDLLIGMFQELPQIERENPGIIHGFCF